MKRIPAVLLTAAALAAGWAAITEANAPVLPSVAVLTLLAAVTTAWPCVCSGAARFSATRSVIAALAVTLPVAGAAAAGLSGILAGTAVARLRRRGAGSAPAKALRHGLLSELLPLLLLAGLALYGHGTFGLPAAAAGFALLVSGDTFLSAVLHDVTRRGVAGLAMRYLLFNAVLVPVTIVLVMAASDGAPGMLLALGLPVAAYSILLDNREKLVTVQRRKTSELSDQNALAGRLGDNDSAGRLVALLDGYLRHGAAAGGGTSLLSRLPGGSGWQVWSGEEGVEPHADELPVTPPGFNRLSGPVVFLGREGVFLGLSETRDLLLFVSMEAAGRLADMPLDIRNNLVLLTVRSWQVTGHHLRSEESFLAAAVTLSRLVDSKDDYTHGHSLRVADLACAIGRRLRLESDEMRTLRVGALLHDLGKIAIDSEILTKKGLLTTDERSVMERHSAEGAVIVGKLRDYDRVADIIRSHHEKLDGSGYPSGLTGRDIPFLARIVTVADTFDAITSTRSYHALIDPVTALDTILEGRGLQFDARVVDALSDIIRSSAMTEGGQHGA